MIRDAGFMWTARVAMLLGVFHEGLFIFVNIIYLKDPPFDIEGYLRYQTRAQSRRRKEEIKKDNSIS
jgi:hypothetical protein